MKKFTFPTDFVWGTATSAYQVEGAASEDGRVESIWDRFSHAPGNIADGATGDVASDQYHRFEEDIDLMVDMSTRAYRFSIAWGRVVPRDGVINQRGVDYYKRLADRLLEAGLEPFPTLYHWDLPQWLQDEGGWTNRDIIDRFASYARVMSDALGDRVRRWTVMNEQWEFLALGLLTGDHAPGHRDRTEFLRATHVANLAHSAAIRAIRGSGRPGLEVGSAFSFEPPYPAADTDADLAAVERRDAFKHGWYLEPLVHGNYPVAFVDQTSALERMDIRSGDAADLKAKIDFIGVNYYDRSLVNADSDDPINGYRVQRGPGPKTAFGWEIWAAGMHWTLTQLDQRYGHPALYITENGCSYPSGPGPDGRVHDLDRVAYLSEHIGQMARAMDDGCDVRGYFAWSLIDNFEWAAGNSERFGLVHCDFENGQRRTIKDSGYWYRDLINSGAIEYDPELG